MPHKEKCTLSRKKVDGKFYYKCKSVDCDKQCLIYVLWELLKEVDKHGEKVVVGQSVREVGCECLEVRPTKWSGPDSPSSCKYEDFRMEDVEKDGKKYRKSVVRCVNVDCTTPKECVFFIEYKDPDKEFGEMIKQGCECKNVKW